ncbi:hypothetical protein [uncultured Aquimarina sp.]|uniref:hypothetical protein n=1 Tax=uncultured Aquimarina sp. TaxID=575652 RepID=UPI00262917C4|nr:hypothetical protein [uncultured Aquimarina sp.]
MQNTVLIFFIFCLSLVVTGQNVNNYQPDKTPTAPSAYSFLKYGDIPMNEYTGRATVTVPIHTIAMDGIGLPLELNYTTGGIRVDQEAGMVGLGWDFNIPAVIQTIKDRDDYGLRTTHHKLPDFIGNPIYPEVGLAHPFVYNYTPAPTYIGMPYASTPTYTDFPKYMLASRDFLVLDGKWGGNGVNGLHDMTFEAPVDSEPDIFRTTINGEELVMTTAGREISNGSDGSVPYSLTIINGKTEYLVSPIVSTIQESGVSYDKVTGIQITTPNAEEYFFEITDEIISFSFSNGHLAPSPGGGTDRITSKIFRLTKIKSRIGNEIEFQYDSVSVSELRKQTQSYFRRRGDTHYTSANSGVRYDGVDFASTQTGYTIQSYFKGNQNLFDRSYTVHDQSQNLNYCTKIITPLEEIRLSYSDRSDYNSKRLDNISIWDLNQKKTNEFSFSYSYSVSNAATDETNRKKQRLILDSITEQGKSPYSFRYNSTKLPIKDSFAVDYWGYYNGKNNDSFIPSFVALGYPEYDDNSQNDFNADLNYTKAQSLERVTYPTGGYTEFEYEANQFDNYLINDRAIINSGHGLRIESVVSYSAENQKAMKKNYTYSGGKAMSKKKLVNTYSEKILERYTDLFNSTTYRSYTTPLIEIRINSFISSSGLEEGDYIGYDKVTITEEQGENGKTEHFFVNNTNYLFNTTYGKHFEPIYIRDREAIRNGTILKERLLDSENNPVSETIYDYYVKTALSNHYGVNFKISETYFGQRGVGGANQEYYYIPYSLLSFYPIFSNSTYLKSKQNIFHTPTGTSRNKTVYYYDSKNRILKEEFFNPTYEIETKLITDYKYQVFTADNFIDAPKQITTTRFDNDDSNGVVISDKHTKYKKYPELNNAILLEDIWECLRLANPSTGNTKNCNNISFTKYDSKGNPLEYRTNEGMITSFIYGYQDNYPIAKLENVSYDDIPVAVINNLKTLSNQDEDTCTSGSCTEQDLRDALDDLRVSFPSGFITTYTYNPLIGVTSTTDPREYAMFYQYDNANRLEFVKDAEGKLISENKYNYKN